MESRFRRFSETPVKVQQGNKWQVKFNKRCLEEFNAEFCQYADAQIQSEGGYQPLRIAEYAEQHCAWGMFQNNVCIHMNWSLKDARYIYNVLQQKDHPDYERLSKYLYLLDGDWQIEELLKRYKARIERKGFSTKWCTNKTVMGEKLSQNLYCAIRLHNWNGGHNYVARVVSKKQELYNK